MRKLVLFAVPFGVSTLVYAYLLSLRLGLIFGICGTVLFLVLCFLKLEKKTQLAIAAAGLAAGFLWSAGYEYVLLRPVWAADGEKTELTATVCDYPVQTDTGWKIHTTVSVNGRKAKTMLYLYEECPDAAPGDTLTVTATLHKTEATEEDDDLYSLSCGYALRAYASGCTVTKCEKTPLLLLPAVFKHKLQAGIQNAVPSDVAGFIQALLTGDKSGISEENLKDISAAGFSHVIAVSGMHVSILLGVIYLLTGKHPLFSTLLGIPVIVFFVLMTGGSHSVVRAGIMQSIILIAPLFRREPDGPTTLCATLLFILLGNPYAITGVSFQLSFGAVAGIFLLSAKAYACVTKPGWVQSLLKCKWTKSPVFFVCSCISTTFGALLFTVPLCALHFGTVSLYAMLSNLLVLCVISFIFGLGLITGLLALFWIPGAKLLGRVLAWPVRYVLWTADWVGALPFASLSASAPYVSMWLIFAYLLLLFAFLLREKKQIVLTGICIFAGLLAALLYTRLDNTYATFSVSVLDVGQGQCVCMQAEAFSFLVDCGGDSGYEAATTAKTYLQTCGKTSLNGMLLTHYDTDHTNGAVKFLSEFSVDTLYLPEVSDDSGNRDEIEAAAREAGTEIVYVTQDMTLSFSEGSLQIFAPVSYYDDNSACLSVLFSAAEYDMLITGDMDYLTEYDLLLTHKLPDVELFVAGHHGSATSSSEELLAQIKPEIVAVSVGENNHYGHPSQEALERFLEVGAEIYCTDECGTITVGR